MHFLHSHRVYMTTVQTPWCIIISETVKIKMPFYYVRMICENNTRTLQPVFCFDLIIWTRTDDALFVVWPIRHLFHHCTELGSKGCLSFVAALTVTSLKSLTPHLQRQEQFIMTCTFWDSFHYTILVQLVSITDFDKKKSKSFLFLLFSHQCFRELFRFGGLN